MGDNILTVVCWKWHDSKWQSRYSADHVNALASMVAKNLKRPHRFVCVTDDARGIDLDIGIVPLWPDLAEMGHCYRRLKAFSKDSIGLLGNNILSIDLDSVVCGDLSSLIPGEDCDFKIAKDTQPPTPYNGSMFFIRNASRSIVWDSFDPVNSPKAGQKLGYCACDQAWIAACLGTQEKVWNCDDGVLSYRNEVLRNHGGKLPANAKIVFFHGAVKPWDKNILSKHDWIARHYRNDRKRLVILGGANCVEDDLKRYSPPDDTEVMVINDMGTRYSGRVDYWVTLHSEKLNNWRSQRNSNWNQNYITIGYPGAKKTELDIVDGGDHWGGSSGLYAVKHGLKMGFEHIVLCGVPMDSRPNLFRPNESEWKQAKAFQEGWVTRMPEMIGKVFSMSGWTKEMLNP